MLTIPAYNPKTGKITTKTLDMKRSIEEQNNVKIEDLNRGKKESE